MIKEIVIGGRATGKTQMLVEKAIELMKAGKQVKILAQSPRIIEQTARRLLYDPAVFRGIVYAFDSIHNLRGFTKYTLLVDEFFDADSELNPGVYGLVADVTENMEKDEIDVFLYGTPPTTPLSPWWIKFLGKEPYKLKKLQPLRFATPQILAHIEHLHEVTYVTQILGYCIF